MPHAPVPAQPSSLQAARSLRDEFQGNQNQFGAAARAHRPMRRVTFELNMAGQQGSMGQFPCLYHDVVREEMNLILVYDHSQPAQMVWFPPVLEDPQTKEPIPIAIMVEGNAEEPTMIYLAYPTGVRFRYRNEEFCLLTVEKEKVAQQGG